jgi:hypothetical protein
MKHREMSIQTALAVALYLLCTSLVLAATDNGTLTKGDVVFTVVCGPPVPLLAGYGPSWGSYSPTGLTGGKTVRGIYDTKGCAGSATAVLEVQGFSSDPGTSWLTSVTCNGVTKLQSAASYTYTSGTAKWSWSSSPFGFFALTNGTNVSCSITHT